ncbi:peptide ABC transporter substrate-binding protein [Bradyrhizobium ottawaense]|uniref:ABC transporter ATP-binding protein n=1 Tax=Bradyrhizobium ottawaense TaxID=931866 RepID=UPI000BEAC45F|nr:oligopeptide/dipeptide ABC transporter ATP-binding protein [Bradyrhizobium ottawaense]PDT64239.1 peptide ABC transporter substrate-binding protein [Bradyrhizobium ottawaense]
MLNSTTKTSRRSSGSTEEVLVEIRNLKLFYASHSGFLQRNTEWVKAVNDVSLKIHRGETFGLVGESGCGKSSLGRSLLRLERPQAGEILFEREDILTTSPRRLKSIRREMQAVFQDPHSSLDPRMSVRHLISEGLVVQGKMGRLERREYVEHLISLVGLRKEHLDRYPHEFSGGQRQRIGIARALALKPKFIVADEPVSALDVSVQSQILNLLSDLQSEFGLTYLFIAHDLSVVEYFSDRVGVMYLGKLVELADAEDLYADPRMPYTKALLSAAPNARGKRKSERIVLRGDVPSPLHPPSGCPFRTRCWMAEEVCAQKSPELREIKPRHWAACHFAENPLEGDRLSASARQG